MIDLDAVLALATASHAGQKRKYSSEEYIVHPIAVAEIVKSVPHTSEMVAAALLHDTIEDTSVSRIELLRSFGVGVYDLVDWLTDVSTEQDGNREQRKAMDRAHISRAPAEAQTIKLADLIDNTRSIAKYDPDFWKVYRREKLLLLEVLTKGDRTLWDRAMAQCEA